MVLMSELLKLDYGTATGIFRISSGTAELKKTHLVFALISCHVSLLLISLSLISATFQTATFKVLSIAQFNSFHKRIGVKFLCSLFSRDAETLFSRSRGWLSFVCSLPLPPLFSYKNTSHPSFLTPSTETSSQKEKNYS